MLTVVIAPVNVINFFRSGGGHFWVYMQYAQGLRALGFEVYWLEGFRGRGSEEEDAEWLAPWLACMQRFGFGGKVLLYPSRGTGDVPDRYVGLETDEAEALFRRADLLLNFHYAASSHLLKRFRRTALVDIDPGLLQFWMSRGQLSVARHDVYFTTGETVGTSEAFFPDCSIRWNYTPPPICLESWPVAFDPGAEKFTTVSNWDADDWIVDQEQTYENTKRVAFLEFADLARMAPQRLELALFLRTERDAEEGRELERRGWSVRHSNEVAGTPEEYRAYIQVSRGEFSCARPSCMRFENAWISDRTLCYLASGKPAVVQHTGPSAFLPDAEGMFRFSSLAEAAGALKAVDADYERHCRAARRLVEDYFDARKVLASLLARAL